MAEADGPAPVAGEGHKGQRAAIASGSTEIPKKMACLWVARHLPPVALKPWLPNAASASAARMDLADFQRRDTPFGRIPSRAVGTVYVDLVI